MNLLVVGVSHHTAPVELLERISFRADEVPAVLSDLVAQPYVDEVVVLSTCNRVEVYATVAGFHSGLAQIGEILATRAGLEVAVLAAHLYVRHDAEAVRHALRVASGLDSMVVGEAQILGQLRDAYGIAAERDSAGRMLHELMQQALRVGKRVHAETSIDRAGRSVVSAALGLAPHGVANRSALVVGAGSMGGLTLALLARSGATPLLVANRGVERAHRLAELHGATTVDINDVATTLGIVDLVVCATASPEPVLTARAVRAAVADRPASRPLVILDLAVPHNVEPEVAAIPGVTLVSMADLSNALVDQPSTVERDAAEEIVAAEVAAFLTWLRGNDVAPTVAALRARADDVVEAELRRLASRRPDLTAEQREVVALTVHRVVQQLLHQPSVRMRQLAATPGGDQYAAAVRELFDLSVLPSDHNLGRAVDIERGEVASA